MRERIEDYARHIGSEHDGALDYIDSWLDPVRHWEQAVER
jgi:hypothetical protein